MHSSAKADSLSAVLTDASRVVIARVVAMEHAPVTVLIDGRSGAGKSSLADRIVGAWPRAEDVVLLRLDQLYPGWDGLAEATDMILDEVLGPRAHGADSHWTGWDWVSSQPSQRHIIPRAVSLVIEGCGSLTERSRALADLAIWVDGPADTRKKRALERDGDGYVPHWERWAAQEEAHIRAHDPRRWADLAIDVP